MKKKYSFKGIIDTTFRDGQQSPLLFDVYKYKFSLEEKKLMLKGLIKLGIRHFEFFSPVVSKSEADDFSQLKKFAGTLSTNKIYFLNHCRCHENDIQKAIEAGFDGLNLFMGVSQHAQKYHFKKSFKNLLSTIKKIIVATRKKYPSLYIRFSAEDAFRTPIRDIFNVYDAIAPYVDTFGIPDTVGIATPDQVKTVIGALKKRYPGLQFECHFHNDRGNSLANSYAAVEAGADFIDTSLWGLAERSGITSTTGFLLNLYHLNKSLCRNYRLEICYPLNILLGSILKLQVPYTEPVSLTNRTHTAGIHQKAVLKNTSVYEAHDLVKFGVSKNQILLGPLSGWNLVYYYVKEIMGYEVSEDRAKEITTLFKNKSAKFSKKFKPEHLLAEILLQFNLTKRPYQKLEFNIIENLT